MPQRWQGVSPLHFIFRRLHSLLGEVRDGRPRRVGGRWRGTGKTYQAMEMYYINARAPVSIPMSPKRSPPAHVQDTQGSTHPVPLTPLRLGRLLPIPLLLGLPLGPASHRAIGRARLYIRGGELVLTGDNRHGRRDDGQGRQAGDAALAGRGGEVAQVAHLRLDLLHRRIRREANERLQLRKEDSPRKDGPASSSEGDWERVFVLCRLAARLVDSSAFSIRGFEGDGRLGVSRLSDE